MIFHSRRPAFSSALPVLALVLIAYTGSASAAAVWLAEAGGTDMGMAGAGRGSLALDATAIAANPAAIGELPESTVSISALPMYLDLGFKGDGSTPGHASNESGVIPLGSAFGVKRADRLTLGVGLYSYLGFSFDLGENWVGDRAIESAGLKSVNVASAAAYRVTDRLQVGATVAAQYAQLDAALAVSNNAAFYGPPVDMPDGRLVIRGDSWAPAGSLGVLFSPSADTRLGAAWTAPVRHSGTIDLEGHGLHPVMAMVLPPPGTVEFDVTFPQQVTLSATHQVTTATSVNATVGWQDWSEFGRAKIRFPGLDAPLFPGGLNDTWTAALGARHQFGNGWGVSAGVAYDSDPTRGGSTPVYFPIAEQVHVAAGIERRLSEDCSVRVALSVINQARARVVQDSHPLPLPGIGPLTGSYEPSRAYMLGITGDFRL